MAAVIWQVIRRSGLQGSAHDEGGPGSAVRPSTLTFGMAHGLAEGRVEWGLEGCCSTNPEFAATAAYDCWPESGSQKLGLQPGFSSQGLSDPEDTLAEMYFTRFMEAKMLSMNGLNVDYLHFQVGDHVPRPLPPAPAPTMFMLSSRGQCWPKNHTYLEQASLGSLW